MPSAEELTVFAASSSLRRRLLAVCLGFSLIVLQPVNPAAAQALPSDPVAPGSASEMSAVERALADRIASDHNIARASAGLAPLREFAPLAQYAGANGETMRASQTLGHSELIALLDDFPRNMWAAENSLVMFNSASDAVGLWLDSEPHANNLMATRATHVWVDVRCADDGRMWVTAQFVERTVDPNVDAIPGTQTSITDAQTADLRCPIATGPFVSAEDFVSQQYHDFLGRDADQEGLAYWTEMLNTKEATSAEVILNFLNSAEFSGRIRPHAERALLDSDTLPSRETVDLWRRSAPRQALVEDTSAIRAEVDVLMIYVGMLDRTPDLEGFAYWTALAQSGASLDALIDGFTFSPEYALRVSG